MQIDLSKLNETNLSTEQQDLAFKIALVKLQWQYLTPEAQRVALSLLDDDSLHSLQYGSDGTFTWKNHINDKVNLTRLCMLFLNDQIGQSVTSVFVN